MGEKFSRILDCFNIQPYQRVVMMGLDNSGKTTILYKLKLGQTVTIMPTVGFNVEILKFSQAKLMVFDVGGQEKLRNLWIHYLQGTSALIYVVDSSDDDRMEIAREELHKILAE